jgi:hypothetical protein
LGSIGFDYGSSVWSAFASTEAQGYRLINRRENFPAKIVWEEMKVGALFAALSF